MWLVERRGQSEWWANGLCWMRRLVARDAAWEGRRGENCGGRFLSRAGVDCAVAAVVGRVVARGSGGKRALLRRLRGHWGATRGLKGDAMQNWDAMGERRAEEGKTEGGALAVLSAAKEAFEHSQKEHAARNRVLWNYYRNPLSAAWWAGAAKGLSGRGGVLGGEGAVGAAQERGLPRRFFGGGRLRGAGEAGFDERGRREIVIENDIAWRVHAMVDFLFNRPVRLTSTSGDEGKARRIGRVLEIAWEASGGMGLMQDAALLAHVYGHVDFLVRIAPEEAKGDVSEAGEGGDLEAVEAGEDERAEAMARRVRIEIVDPTRGVALLSDEDYRRFSGYVVRTRRAVRGEAGDALVFTEVFSGGERWLFSERVSERGELIGRAELVERGRSIGGRDGVPVVHVQNVSQPFRYEGLSEVEPLIALQDELNTRLSDRANRVTLQCFKMYLAKGVEGFEKTPVGPGTVWTSENPDAKIEAFGGDSANPSEETHIDEVREAMDKVSGVPPLAAGVVRAKIGNLTSENALRVTLQGLLTRTARKRVAWGRGIAGVCAIVLEALDAAGVLRTGEMERGVNVEWSDALPRDVGDELRSAQAKAALGVDRGRVLADLGIGSGDRGVE